MGFGLGARVGFGFPTPHLEDDGDGVDGILRRAGRLVILRPGLDGVLELLLPLGHARLELVAVEARLEDRGRPVLDRVVVEDGHHGDGALGVELATLAG